MPLELTTIAPRGLLSVNAYLIHAGDGFVLIDTGMPKGRANLETRMRAAGCARGNVKLLVVTHAHIDHTGSCAYVRDTFGAPIAMHEGDVSRARSGSMSGPGTESGDGPKKKGLRGLFGAFGRFDPFEPDVLLAEGQRLAEYGLDATVLHLPGHSPGSVGILFDTGEFFCGDLFTNYRKPGITPLVDDATLLRASAARAVALPITTVYPGHGSPFPLSALAREVPAG